MKFVRSEVYGEIKYGVKSVQASLVLGENLFIGENCFKPEGDALCLCCEFGGSGLSAATLINGVAP